MLVFPHAKINLGLQVGKKRPDGYHEIRTLFYPIPVYDALEITPNEKLKFLNTGLKIPGDPRENICLKAFKLVQDEYGIPSVRIHLHKVIPFGAGLGGGSSDGSFTLKALDQLFDLSMSRTKLIEYAAKLGSDCPYFINGGVQIGSGRGEKLKRFELDLSGFWGLLINPGIHIDTGQAYSICEKVSAFSSFEETLAGHISHWEGKLSNSFQFPMEEKFPELKVLKAKLVEKGAKFVSMSGSGSSYFALFDSEPSLLENEPGYFQFKFAL